MRPPPPGFPRRRARRLLLATLALGLAGCTWSSESRGREECVREFRRDFDLAPPAAASAFRVRRVRVGDSQTTWISFHCDEAAFRALGRGDFEAVSRSALGERGRHPSLPDVAAKNPNAPDWWPVDPLGSVATLDDRERPYQEGAGPPESSSSYFWRDAATGRVFAYHRTGS